MDELLQKLLESAVLSADTKSDLETAFKTKIEEAVNEARASAEADVRAELTEQFIAERDALVEAIDVKLGEFLDAEINELKEDIERFRDLEAEYAEKLVEAKAAMADELKGDIGQLVEKMDSFLEMRLSSELEELREDFVEVRKNEFGRRIYEAFAAEFVDAYADEENNEDTLRSVQQNNAELTAQLEEAVKQRNALERKIKMDQVLAPLSGSQRDVMESILKNVSTSHLEEAYGTFIGRVMRKPEESNSEKEKPVLAEGTSQKKVAPEKSLNEKVKDAVVATGDTEETVVVKESQNTDRTRHLDEIRRLAGMAPRK